MGKDAVSKELQDAVKAILKESKEKGADGKFVMHISDRLGVIDRALKLEALQHKIREQGEGSGWADEDTGGSDG